MMKPSFEQKSFCKHATQTLSFFPRIQTPLAVVVRVKVQYSAIRDGCLTEQNVAQRHRRAPHASGASGAATGMLRHDCAGVFLPC